MREILWFPDSVAKRGPSEYSVSLWLFLASPTELHRHSLGIRLVFSRKVLREDIYGYPMDPKARVTARQTDERKMGLGFSA